MQDRQYNTTEAQMRPSHYASYVLERLGKSTIEDDRGFAVYSYIGEVCYIEEIYVAPEHRSQNVASSYADQISAEARSKGATALLGSVNPKAKNGTTSLKVLLAYGFELDWCDNTTIYLKKVI